MLLERSFRNAKIDISTNLGRFLLNKLTELGYGETEVEVYGQEVFGIWTECGTKRIAEIISVGIEKRDDVCWEVYICHGQYTRSMIYLEGRYEPCLERKEWQQRCLELRAPICD